MSTKKTTLWGHSVKLIDITPEMATLVTPEMAAEFLRHNYENNRPLNQSHINNLVRDLENNDWKLTHQGACFDEDGVLLDAQHRFSAIVRADKPALMLLFRNAKAQFEDPIDRGKIRSISLLTRLPTAVVAALQILNRLEQGDTGNYNKSGTPALVMDVHAHYVHGLEKVQRVTSASHIYSALCAAVLWMLPIDEEAVLDFLQKATTGEMIKKEDPAYAFRRWRAYNPRAHSMETTLAAINCIRAHIVGWPIKSVYPAPQGYRASVSRRRAMKIPYTPDTSLVDGVSWMMGVGEAKKKEEASES